MRINKNIEAKSKLLLNPLFPTLKKGIIQLFIVSLPKVPEFWCSFFLKHKITNFRELLFYYRKKFKQLPNIKPNPRNGEQPDVYFDEELYKNRFKIEQANGWLDGYKGLIMRYEYLDVTWIGMLLLGFISKFLKKV